MEYVFIELSHDRVLVLAAGDGGDVLDKPGGVTGQYPGGHMRLENRRIFRVLREQGPVTPKGGCTGVLVYEIEGRGPFFCFGRVATYTRQ